MRRLSPGLHQEYAELMLHNENGMPPYQTGLYELDGHNILCVATPQSKAQATFEAVDACRDETFEHGFLAKEIVHDTLGVEDDVIVWISQPPSPRSVRKGQAEQYQSVQFVTREQAWNEADAKAKAIEWQNTAPPAAMNAQVEGAETDDLGSAIPPDLGDLDMGEHDAEAEIESELDRIFGPNHSTTAIVPEDAMGDDEDGA